MPQKLSLKLTTVIQNSYEYLHNNLAWKFAHGDDEQLVLAAIRKAGIRICGTEKELLAGSDRLPECTLIQPKSMSG